MLPRQFPCYDLQRPRNLLAALALATENTVAAQ